MAFRFNPLTGQLDEAGSPIPPTTPFTRDFLAVEDAAAGRAALDQALPYSITSFNGATDLANGTFQKGTVSAATTLGVPTNGTEGARLELWLTCDGTNRALSKHANILLPSDSAISFPKTLTANKRYILLLKCVDASNWMLVSFVGGY
jgi:hypothetical protein